MLEQGSVYTAFNDPALDMTWYAWQDNADISSLTIPFLQHELMLNLGDVFEVNDSGGHGQVIYSGICVHTIKTVAKGNYRTMGVMFSPAGIYSAYGLSISEFNALSVSADDLLFNRRQELLQRLAAAGSDTAKLEVFSDFFFRHRRGRTCPPVVERFLKTVHGMATHPVEVKRLADYLHYSSKHLISTFRDVAGITPKKYIQLLQVNLAVQCMKRHPHRSLTEIALEHGFYDQSHFIRVFGKFTGMTPRGFRTKQRLQRHDFANTVLC